jgi:hypothetical protein
VKFISERNDSPYVVRDSSAVITVKKGILLKACATASVRILLVLTIDYFPRDMFYKLRPFLPLMLRLAGPINKQIVLIVFNIGQI